MKKRALSRARLKRIRLVLLDVDGVMTDGSILYTSTGTELKSFDVKDGYGIVKGRRAGLQFGIITGKRSPIVLQRARELDIREVYQNSRDKEKDYVKILKKLRVAESEAAFIGDDEPDLPVLRRVGFSAAPADALAGVRHEVDYVCAASGGHGAVREVIDLILGAREASWTRQGR